MRWLATLALTGCVVGGGPTIGIRQHKPVVGFEVGGGALLQGAIGYSGGDGVFVRADLVPDFVGLTNGETPTHHATARLGGGIGSNDRGVFAIGGGAAFMLSPATTCGDWFPAAIVTVDRRYIGAWQWVLAPRFEMHHSGCTH